MGRSCSYGQCNSSVKTIKCRVKGAEGVFFIKFPNPKTDLERCQQWISACGRKNFTIKNINNSTFICSRHFEGFGGPTLNHPDPIPLYKVLMPLLEKQSDEVPLMEHSVGSVLMKRKTSVAPNGRPKVLKRKEIDLTAHLREESEEEFTRSLEMEQDTSNYYWNEKELFPPQGWALEANEYGVTFIKQRNNYTVIKVILRVVKFQKYPLLSVRVMALDKVIPTETIAPNGKIRSNDEVYDFLYKFNNFVICPGNPDPELVDVYKSSRKRECSNYSTEKSYYCHILNSIYSKNCLALLKKSSKNHPRCHECSKYRSTLRKMKLHFIQRCKKICEDTFDNLNIKSKKNKLV